MRAGINFSDIKVDNNMICDGHHRYIASLFANFPLERISGVITSATTEVNWNSVIFDDEDWDTSAKIKMLNEQDAEFNNIQLKELIELLK